MDLFNIFKLILISLNICLFLASIYSIKNSSQTTNRKGAILFSIAHPDDESMFFTPTISALVDEGREIYLQSFSSGNYESKGEVRIKELQQSCSLFGLKKENVFVHDHPQLQDGPQNKWDQEIIKNLMKEKVLKHDISTIISFDPLGVSNHPNHVSVASSLLKLKKELKIEKITKNSIDEEIFFFQLESVSFFRKYLAIFDILISALFSLFPSHNNRIFFTCYSFLKSWKQMNAHSSQFLWYRKLFVIFSRYSYLNTLIFVE